MTEEEIALVKMISTSLDEIKKGIDRLNKKKVVGDVELIGKAVAESITLDELEQTAQTLRKLKQMGYKSIEL